ncbi:MAG TPA: hypothetical protein VF188_17095 [Longimicrobiales bacterium]
MMSAPLYRNPAIRVFPLDSDVRDEMVLCEIPHRDRAPTRYALPAKLLTFLDCFDGTRETSDILRTIDPQEIGVPQTADLDRLVSELLVPRGFLLSSTDDGAVAQAPTSEPRSNRRSPLYLRIPLLRSRILLPIVSVFRPMFRRSIAIPILVLIAGSHLVFYASILPQYSLEGTGLRTDATIQALLLVFLGGLIHEIGHATAGACYGCRRLEIGCGLYLYLVVLYTDLSEAWRLPRRQRAVVDLAGIYFQAAFVALLPIIHAFTGWTAPLSCFLISDLLIAASLNPFLRLDGYWLLSDAFGILNLRTASLAFLHFIKARLTLRGDRRAQMPWSLSRRSMVVLGIYVVFGTGFFAYLTVVLAKRLAMTLIQTYPHVVRDFLGMFADRPGDSAHPWTLALDIAWRGLVVIWISFIAFHMSRRLIRRLRQSFGVSRGLLSWSVRGGK